MCVTWRIHDGRDTSRVWILRVVYVTWLVLLIRICNVISLYHLYMWRDWLICVTWRIYVIWFVYFIYICDVTGSCVWHGAYMTEEICHMYGSSLIYVTWLVLFIHMCNVISFISFTSITWLVHLCDMAHTWRTRYVTRMDPQSCHVTCSHGGHVQEYLDHKVNTLDMTHPYVWHAASSFIYEWSFSAKETYI